MNPLDGKNTVINFIDEVNKQRSLDNAYDSINNDPTIKLRRLNETKQKGVDTCMNHILSKICMNAIPEVNGRVADTPDLDKFVSDYIARRSCGKGLEFYVKEAIRKNPKNTSVIKNVYESVQKIVNGEYMEKTLNPESITEEDYDFKMTPEITDKLSAVIRDNHLDDLADVIKDNVRDTAITEVELAKKEKEDRLALEEELTNDESITTESALMEALKEREVGKSTSIYTPSLFEGVMISKFNAMESVDSKIGETEFNIPEYVTEGVIDKIKASFKAKAESDAKVTISKSHPTFIASIEGMYKAIYSEYRSKIVPINIKKLSKMAKDILKSPVVTGELTVKAPNDLDSVKKEVEDYRASVKGMMESKKKEMFECKSNSKVYKLEDAISEMNKAVSALDSFFENPDVKSYVNKASTYVSTKANKCDNPKDVIKVYEIALEYYVADLYYYSAAITYVVGVVDIIKSLIAKYENKEVKEAAFDNAITEYTLLNISKALYLESFNTMDVERIAKEYAMN